MKSIVDIFPSVARRHVGFVGRGGRGHIGTAIQDQHQQRRLLQPVFKVGHAQRDRLRRDGRRDVGGGVGPVDDGGPGLAVAEQVLGRRRIRVVLGFGTELE